MMGDKVKKELEYFKSICSVEDYEKVTSEDMTFEEFLRLDYILGTIGLNYLEIYFFNKQSEKFEGKIKEMEMIEKEHEGLEDVEKYDEWLEEFISKISDNNIKIKYMDKYKVVKE